MTRCDVAAIVTGGYFQNGRKSDVLEGNTRRIIYHLKTTGATIGVLCRSANIITRLYECVRQTPGTMSVSIGDKIEVSSFVGLTPTS